MKAWRLSNMRIGNRIAAGESRQVVPSKIKRSQVQYQFNKIEKIPSALLMALLARIN